MAVAEIARPDRPRNVRSAWPDGTKAFQASYLRCICILSLEEAIMRPSIVIPVLAALALALPATAQNKTPAPSTTHTAPAPAAGQWRASKLIGLDVYNQQNKKVGDINEVILDQSGKVAGVVVGVGGFLGMGEHDVLIAFDQIKFVNEPVRSSSTTAPRPATTGTAATTDNSSDHKWYPDHAVINATKDQLKAMPQFKYS
jgi:sporulation protein YlmC with PRC-barrel domain